MTTKAPCAAGARVMSRYRSGFARLTLALLGFGGTGASSGVLAQPVTGGMLEAHASEYPGPPGQALPRANGIPGLPGVARHDVVTYHNDVERTGLNSRETILTPANVNAQHFGKIGFFRVDGKVDAQPLYLSGLSIPALGTHNVLYIATEHDSVYAFDADRGSVLWRRSLLGPGERTSDTRSCGQVVPEIGVTATPVIDRTRGPHGAVYVVAMSKDNSGHYFQRLHALDAAQGTELFGGPQFRRRIPALVGMLGALRSCSIRSNTRSAPHFYC